MTETSQRLKDSKINLDLTALQSTPRQPRVLIAEDHDDTRFMLRTLLANRGIETLEASSGEDAVEVAVRQRPDLIFMDASLPRLDGFEATRLIRCINSLKQVPIIFLSGYSGRKQRERAFAVGGTEYFIKPLDLQLLTNALARFTK